MPRGDEPVIPVTVQAMPAAPAPTSPAPSARPGELGRDDERVTRRPVPVRTILAAIGLVLVTVVLLDGLWQVRRTLTWIVIAAFFAVTLSPVASWLERHLSWCRRSLATLIVFVVGFAVFAGVVAVFAVPLAHEATQLAAQLPHQVEEARAGHGPIGHLLEKTNALDYVRTHQAQLKSLAAGLTTPAVGVLKGIATGVAGVITIVVLAFLMVLEGPRLVDAFLNLFEPRRAHRMRRVGHDCAKSVTGYVSGNLLISLICGALTYAVLRVLGVPYAGLLALFVGLADLIPLIGATLGAVVACVAAGIESLTAFVVVAVFFVLYQQLENHLLQPVVLSRTVKLNPLTVLVSILLAVELAGILGALLAIPVAGMVQVISRDVWDHRRGAPKPEPTVGEERRPASTG